MMIKKEFIDAKEKALRLLNEAYTQEKVDGGILPILEICNKISGVYTSSSCAGRIVLLEIPSIGDKRAAAFLGIWHRTIDSKELRIAATKARKGFLWLLAQAPIIHIGVETLELADKIVKTAVSCGFKNSAIKSLGKKIILEVCSTERLDAPIGKDGILFCQDTHLFVLVEISNEIIERSQKKLITFAEKLAKISEFL